MAQYPPTDESRFGVSLQHAQEFIQEFKNQQINGYKICSKYYMDWKSASVHAESFAWAILEYKVSSIIIIKVW